MKKKALVIIGIGILIGILYLGYDIIRPMFYFKDVQLKSISYSRGGGYGTQAEAATKTITIYSNGLVTFTNSYNNKIKEDFYITENEYKKLEKVVMNNSKIFINKPKENRNVLDGSSSYIKIVTTDDIEYEVGGYMINNYNYNNITKYIFSTVGENKFLEYEERVKNSEQVY